MTVADLGERALIERIRARVPSPPPWVIVGIGDDAAAVEPEPRTLDVFTTDGLVEGVHFDRAFAPARTIGHKALAVNLSDLAAMGAMPRAALLSLALPPDWAVDDFDALLDGLLALAARFRVSLVGGNVSRSPGPLLVSMTAVGTAHRRRLLPRGGARPGDHLYLSGAVGAAAAGLQWLQATTRAKSESTPGSRSMPVLDATDTASMPGVAQRYLEPEPRVRLGVLLGRNGAASACVDLSDGLADAVRHLAGASGVGAVVDGDAVPIVPQVRRWFQRCGFDPLPAALGGGEDYELLFTVSPRRRGRFIAAERLVGDLPLTRIGTVTADRAMVLRRGTREEALPAGFAHFG